MSENNSKQIDEENVLEKLEYILKPKKLSKYQKMLVITRIINIPLLIIIVILLIVLNMRLN